MVMTPHDRAPGWAASAETRRPPGSPHETRRKATAGASAAALRRSLSVSLLCGALLGACAQAPRPAPGPEPVMPASLRQTVTDPARTAIGFTDAVFGRPASVAGRPAVVADAVAELEWLAVAIATDQRWIGMPPLVAQQLRAGRDETRAALGIPADATTNAVVTALDATAAALRAGNRAAALTALGEVTGSAGAERALGVLSALPRLPRAAAATAAAANGLTQLDQNTRGR